jgi:hypothetical protein
VCTAISSSCCVSLHTTMALMNILSMHNSSHAAHTPYSRPPGRGGGRGMGRGAPCLPPAGPYTITIQGYHPATRQDELDAFLSEKAACSFNILQGNFSKDSYTLMVHSKAEAEGLISLSGIRYRAQRLEMACLEAQGASGGVRDQVGGPKLPDHVKLLLTNALTSMYTPANRVLMADNLAKK